jgi:diguanylate cyclase (GGDEF)-like protein
VGAHGLLNLRAAAGGAVLSERRQLVAVALAYQVASGLSNLRLKEILREEAIRDPVTGLFNRRFMKESLEHELQRALRNHGSVGVISFDLDHFKGVNDTLGHAAGDALLVAVAHLARESLRAVDICCRQGGDEFLLILLDANPADVLRLAEGLRAGVEKLSREIYPGLMAPVTLSAGVALSPQDAATAEGLQKAADRALYRAKSLGRNRVFAASGLEPAARAA